VDGAHVGTAQGAHTVSAASVHSPVR
jgi:hypothetical protein